MIKAAVLGSPISHSLSPLLHTTAYRELDVEGSYEAIDLKAGGLAQFIASLDSSWNAFSLTMPLKEEAVLHASLVDSLAKRINSANTLFKVDGSWQAATTDVDGFTNALKMHEVQIRGHVVILGAGATARAAAAACDGQASVITIVNRSGYRKQDMSQVIVKSQFQFMDWDHAGILADADLVISTVPAGATDSLTLPQTTSAPFFEALYNPWPTLASKEWALRGGLVIDGLDLLIHQAISQIEIFSGTTFDRMSMYKLLRKVGVLALK